MTKSATTFARLLTLCLGGSLFAPAAFAQEPPPPPPGYDPNEAGNVGVATGDPAEVNPPPPDEAAPIPQYAEGPPQVYQNSTGYCFAGPHPIDAREGRGNWDPSEGTHVHAFPPIDLRLFTFHNGCYYFTGDPTDFGYAGTVFPYYGAHPVQDTYGGGWCFMVGGHSHSWRPWSPYFVVTGSWYYWRGAYDAYFWSYWPYYSFYYRSHYPRYYGGGRYWRGREYHAAPPITYVPRGPGGRGSGSWRGSPTTTWRGSPTGTVRGGSPQGWRGDGAHGHAPAAPAANVWHGSPTRERHVAPSSPSPPAYGRPSGAQSAPSYTPRAHSLPPSTFRSAPAPAARGGGTWRGHPR